MSGTGSAFSQALYFRDLLTLDKSTLDSGHVKGLPPVNEKWPAACATGHLQICSRPPAGLVRILLNGELALHPESRVARNGALVGVGALLGELDRQGRALARRQHRGLLLVDLE